jgi:cytoskeletal protein CcmA (bactofilin family)
MEGISTIGPGAVLRGSIHGDGDVEIHGRVDGTVVVTGELVIAETAIARSDLSGRRVVVRGVVVGNISAKEAVVLEAGARVVGDLGAPQVGIRPGALVRGNVTTGSPLVLSSPTTATATRGRVGVAPIGRGGPAAPVRGQPARASRVISPPASSAAVARAPSPRSPVVARVVQHPDNANESSTTAAPREETTAGGDEGEKSDDREGPPPPVVPTLRKGTKAQLRRKGAR